MNEENVICMYNEMLISEWKVKWRKMAGVGGRHVESEISQMQTQLHTPTHIHNTHIHRNLTPQSETRVLIPKGWQFQEG